MAPIGSIIIDRKSRRLNSSHRWISYAVFCLKKNAALAPTRFVGGGKILFGGRLPRTQQLNHGLAHWRAGGPRFIHARFFFNVGAPPPISHSPLTGPFPI